MRSMAARAVPSCDGSTNAGEVNEPPLRAVILRRPAERFHLGDQLRHVERLEEDVLHHARVEAAQFIGLQSCYDNHRSTAMMLLQMGDDSVAIDFGDPQVEHHGAVEVRFEQLNGLGPILRHVERQLRALERQGDRKAKRRFVFGDQYIFVRLPRQDRFLETRISSLPLMCLNLNIRTR